MATHSQAHKQAIDAGLGPYNNSIFCGLWQEQKKRPVRQKHVTEIIWQHFAVEFSRTKPQITNQEGAMGGIVNEVKCQRQWETRRQQERDKLSEIL